MGDGAQMLEDGIDIAAICSVGSNMWSRVNDSCMYGVIMIHGYGHLRGSSRIIRV
jgi:hypothetical protein